MPGSPIEKEPGVMVEFTGDGGLDTTSDDSEQLGGEVTSPMSKAANRHSKQEREGILADDGSQSDEDVESSRQSLTTREKLFGFGGRKKLSTPSMERRRMQPGLGVRRVETMIGSIGGLKRNGTIKRKKSEPDMGSVVASSENSGGAAEKSSLAGPKLIVSEPAPMDLLSSEDKLLIKRKNIVMELYTSEESYTEHLNRLNVIRDEIDGMKRKEECHSVLRRVVDKALQVHYAHTTVTRLKNSLDRRVLEYDKQQQISPPIEASFGHSAMKEAYTRFILEHSKSQLVLKNARNQNQSFDQMLIRFEDRYPDKLNIEALLMKPVQKLPQLILILQRLLSSCDTKHPDRQGLQRAVMAVEQLAHDLNDMKGQQDLTRHVEQLRDLFAKSHKTGTVDLLIPKEQIGLCARRDEVKIMMLTPFYGVSYIDGIVLLFPGRILLFAKSKGELRGERLMCLLSGDIGRVQCIGHEIFFKMQMCDSVDQDLVDDWNGVNDDEGRLNILKAEVDKLNREYKDLNSGHVSLALKENEAVKKDVLQSIKVAGCIDVFFSAEPDRIIETDPIPSPNNEQKSASEMHLSQWKLTFSSKEESASFNITLKMLQMATQCWFANNLADTLSSPVSDDSTDSRGRMSLEQTMGINGSLPRKNSPSNPSTPPLGRMRSPLPNRKTAGSTVVKKDSITSTGSGIIDCMLGSLVGCWIKTNSDKSSVEKYLSQPMLHSITKVNSDAKRELLSQSTQDFFEGDEVELVCALPLSNAPNICPLALEPKQTFNFDEKTHPEVLLCYGAVWLIHSSPTAYRISVYSLCESGAIHSLTNGRKMAGGKQQAFCAVAVPGLDVDDSFVQWMSNQQSTDVNSRGGGINKDTEEPAQRPKVLSQQSVWIGTDSGVVVYRVSSKTGIGSRVFTLPTDVEVKSIAYANGNVVAGLENGLINVYTRSYAESSYGVWNRTAVVIDMNESLSRQQIRGANDDDGSEDSSQGSKGGSDDDHEEEDLGSIPQGPVTCIILPFNDCLKSVADAAQVVDVAWCSIAHQIFIISIISRKILYKIELPLLQTVEFMASIGVSVFVCCKQNRTVQMFHAETYEQLSIISLDKSIMAFAKHIGLPDDGAPASPYSSKDPRARVKMQEQQVKGRRSFRRDSNYLSGMHPSAMAIHSGSLWVGTSGGHLVRFETSKIGLIPAIREPKVCAYYFGEKPVKSIIFTGKKYQAAHQKVIMSGLGGGKNSQGANFERKSGLNNRKLSDSKDTRSMSSSTMWLNEPKDDVSGLDASLAPSLGDVRRDRAPALNVDQDEFGRSTSASLRIDEGYQMEAAFPMLTAKQDKSVSSNVVLPTYVMALGENLCLASGGSGGAHHSTPLDSGVSMLTFQIL